MPPRGSTASPVLATALRAYVEARAAAFLAARKELGIGELDARALLFIVDHPGTRPGEVRAYLGITSAGVTTLTDRLVERRVIRRDLHDEDRRMVRLTATVDLSTDPWSALTSFDTGIASAIDELDATSSRSAADLLDGLLKSVAARTEHAARA